MAIAVLHESTFADAAVNDASPWSSEPAFNRDASSSPRNRRADVRLSAEDATWLRGARLKYGPDVRVIDVSTGGILVESDGAPLTPQSNVVFELSGPTGTMLVPAKVLRSHAVQDGTRFHTACAFRRPLSIGTLAAARSAMPAPVVTRTSWQRVVARFRNGKVVRGYTNDFHPSKPHLHLSAEDKTGETVLVPVAQLKAVFFVRDFAGDPLRIDSNEFDGASHGRKVEVAFSDGEVLRGTTLGYRSDGSGFFVQPADAKSNNMRVFVAPGATLHVRFL